MSLNSVACTLGAFGWDSTAPASKPVITDSKGIEVRNVSGLYDSGTPLTLICTVTQGKFHSQTQISQFSWLCQKRS